jgi:hypothetical protein
LLTEKWLALVRRTGIGREFGLMTHTACRLVPPAIAGCLGQSRLGDQRRAARGGAG